MYQFCDNSELQTLRCPSGKAFSHATSKCEDANTIDCSETFDPPSESIKTIPSFADYMTSYLRQNVTEVSRSKRDIDMPEIVYSFISPLVSDIFEDLTITVLSDAESFMNNVILPTFYEVIGDSESRYDVLGLWISAKSAYAPVGWEMMKRQKHDTPEGTVIQIPRKIIEEANDKFYNNSMPFIYKLLDGHLGGLLHRAGDYVPVLIENLKNLDKAKIPYSGVLKDAILNFVVKHGQLLQNSTSTPLKFYSLTEIMNDLIPIKVTFLQILKDFYAQNKDSILDEYRGESSLLHLGSQGYATPETYYTT